MINILISILIISCASPQKRHEQQGSQNEVANSAEDFDGFYKKFHNDSLFQMGRIKFPLEGVNVDGFDRQGWVKDKWRMHEIGVDQIDKSQFKFDISKTDSLYVERIYIEASGFEMIRTFELVKNKWFLVKYYDRSL